MNAAPTTPAIANDAKRGSHWQQRLVPPSRLKLLDLFCGEGGAGEGYKLTGFDVTGVDIAPQRKNPHRFVLGDALEYLRAHGHEYDAIHASPPCQAYTSCQKIRGREHAKLIEPTREALKAAGKPWVIENVEGSPLQNPVMLCGSMFGLKVRRHRLFETSFPIQNTLPPCDHSAPAVTIIGHGVYPSSLGVRHKGTPSLGYQAGRDAMEIQWMSWDKLSQAIPPAYTKWIGELLRVAAWRNAPHQPPPGKEREPR